VLSLWGHANRLAGTGFSFSETFEIISNTHLYTTCKRKPVCFKRRWKTLRACSLSTVIFGCAKKLRVSAVLLPQVTPETQAPLSLYAKDLSQLERKRDSPPASVCNHPRQIVKKAITGVADLLVLHYSLPRGMFFSLSLAPRDSFWYLASGRFLAPVCVCRGWLCSLVFLKRFKHLIYRISVLQSVTPDKIILYFLFIKMHLAQAVWYFF